MAKVNEFVKCFELEAPEICDYAPHGSLDGHLSCPIAGGTVAVSRGAISGESRPAARRCRRAERRCGFSGHSAEAHPLCGQSRRRPGGVRDRTRGSEVAEESQSRPAMIPRRFPQPASPRTRPAEIGEVRVVRRGAGAGARGRSSASAVPSQRRHFRSRTPPMVGSGRERRRGRPRRWTRSERDAYGGLRGWFSGREWWTSRVISVRKWWTSRVVSPDNFGRLGNWVLG